MSYYTAYHKYLILRDIKDKGNNIYSTPINMKKSDLIIKCKHCGYEIAPFVSYLIEDTWIKNNITYYTFVCPKCNTVNTFFI